MITLTALSGPDAGSVFTLKNDVIVIGRSSACDVMLHDGALGRRHSEIRHEGGQVFLTDLGSVNGTFVNDQRERVTTCILKNRDEISFGKSRLRVEFSEQEEEASVSATAPVSASPQLLLRVIQGKDRGRVFELQPGVKRFTVGRGQEANFVLEDRRVSRIHCTVERTPAGFLLMDEGSLNGTFVNDNPTRISCIELHGGDILRLSDTRIQVETFPLEDATVFAASTQFAPSQPPTQAEQSTAPYLASQTVKQPEAVSPLELPPEPSHFWTAFAMLGLVTASAVLFLRFDETTFFSSGPVAAAHAKWEKKCVTCHPSWGVQPVNATCGTTDCHANVLQVNVRKQDDCAACHSEHRGRNFNLVGDATRCWACHEATFSKRLAWQHYQQIASFNISSAAPSPLALPLHNERQALQLHVPQQETGLIFAHAAHAKSSKQEDCQTCHQPLPGTVINALGAARAFPSHEECIRCHVEVGDREPETANARASTQCRKCHVREGNKVTRPSRSLSYVQFSHDNHKTTDCVVCHFPISNEDRYRPGLRSVVYPLPMEACLSCHKEQHATVSCLDCHRAHHSSTPASRTGPDWLRRISLEAVLLALLILEAGVGTCLYFIKPPRA